MPSDDVAPPSAVPSDGEGAPIAAVLPHWDALIARSGGAPAVRWGDRGTPLALFGELSAPRGSLAGDGARGFLAENARLFQLSGDLAELSEEAVVDSPLGTHVTLAQRFEGVRVHGAEVRVSFSSDGRIIAVANTSVPGIAVDTLPRISAERALAVALAGVAVDRSDADAPDAPQLV
ncbi:MAG TPA: hypothetical protein VK601_27275, partial [Kofleriaceae bacterium]|nr:hypothetical protein [Kofleriaceae bacterium]